MAATQSLQTSRNARQGRRHCLSCAVALTDRRRRYCSVECRQRLRRKLTLRTGLLKALNTRYATFYITETRIVLDILPFDSKEIFSYIFTRTHTRKPADDFNHMANILGNVWWSERKRTRKKYLASRHLLAYAEKNQVPASSVKPQVLAKPSVNGSSLVHLRLNKSVLSTPGFEKEIKSAYRKQAKRHHPDRGGDSSDFRKIRRAYEELIRWMENPVFTQRRGFHNKWFYDGYSNRWVQPTPLSS